MRFILATALLVMALTATGCFVYEPVQIIAASKPVPDLDRIEVLGKVSGRSCQHFVLFPVWVEVPLQNAMREAKRSVGADALINVTADSVSSSYLLYRNVCVTVRGDAIRYIN